MAVYDKELEKRYKEAVMVEKSFATKEEAVENAIEQAKDNIVSVWKCEDKYFVLPFEKWIDAERLDYEQVVEAWVIRDKSR